MIPGTTVDPAAIAPLDTIGAVGLVPVVELPDVRAALPLADALLEAELPVAEITLRTDSATEGIRLMRERRPELLVGAGSVLSVAQAEEAMEAGAGFLVAPGFNRRVVDHALDRAVPIVPGACTPTEIEAALAVGIEIVKFFPAEAAGSVGFLAAVSPVYPMMHFIPTGGIGPQNLATYLALPSVYACGGSWMVRRALLEAGDFATVRRLSAEAVRVARDRPG